MVLSHLVLIYVLVKCLIWVSLAICVFSMKYQYVLYIDVLVYVTCGLTAYTLGAALSPMLNLRIWEYILIMKTYDGFTCRKTGGIGTVTKKQIFSLLNHGFQTTLICQEFCI